MSYPAELLLFTRLPRLLALELSQLPPKPLSALATVLTVWWSFFTGVDARLLVFRLFAIFPAHLAPAQACACATLSSDSSKSIASISLALAPIPTAVWPVSAAGGAHPLVSTFWPTFGRTCPQAGPTLLSCPTRCPLSSSAGYPGSERPSLLSGCHHPGEFNTGAGVCLQRASMFITARNPLHVAAHLVPTCAQTIRSHPLCG